MKIINSTTRDAIGGIDTTRVSELEPTYQLQDKSLFLLIDKNDGTTDSYTAKKILAETIKQKLFCSIGNSFKHSYWETQFSANEKHSTKEPYKGMISYISGSGVTPPDEVSLESPFVDHINYDFSLLTAYVMAKDTSIENSVASCKSSVDEIDCQFTADMTICTTKLTKDSTATAHMVETDESVNHIKTVDDHYCQMAIPIGNKISNEWTVPKSGNLVAYGWLDSSAVQSSKAIPQAYCALEGYINGSWEIIGVQGVIPGKNITYVGFNAIVKKGLKIRTRTGFACGSKSGQFSNEQDGYDTLANDVVNGFKCQVFSKTGSTED